MRIPAFPVRAAFQGRVQPGIRLLLLLSGIRAGTGVQFLACQFQFSSAPGGLDLFSAISRACTGQRLTR